jgi:hypothetical protein
LIIQKAGKTGVEQKSLHHGIGVFIFQAPSTAAARTPPQSPENTGPRNTKQPDGGWSALRIKLYNSVTPIP